MNIIEVPVGAVIVKNNKVISKAYNKKEKIRIKKRNRWCKAKIETS